MSDTDTLTPTIGAYDAKAHLSALLDRVEQGEEIIITRHGTPVARLVPERRGIDVAEALKSVERLRTIHDQLVARGVSITQDDIRAMRDEGRR